MESNDEFQFRPITRGLGFHPHQSGSGANTSGGGTSPSTGNSTGSANGSGINQYNQNSKATSNSAGASNRSSRVTAESVSKLITSLPALDFEPNEASLDRAASRAPVQRPTVSLPGQRAPAGGTAAGGPSAKRKFLHTPFPKKAAGAPGTTSSAMAASATSSAAGVIPGIPARDARRIANGPTASPTSSSPVEMPAPVMAPLITSSAPSPAYFDVGTLETESLKRGEAVVIDEVKYRETPFLISAAAFDLFVVVGMTCLFAVALLLVTSTDLSLVLHNAQSDWATRAGMLLLFFSVHALYMVGSRSVAGCTLGEWAFDVELGLPPQQATAWYPLAICARYAVVVLTGFVTLPILSLIMKQDLTSHLCGLKLYQAVK